MAFPQVTSQTGGNDTTAASSVDVAMPASGIAAGDLVVIWLCIDENTTFGTIPAKLSFLRQGSDSAPTARVGLFAFIADGTENGTTINIPTSVNVEASVIVVVMSAASWFGGSQAEFTVTNVESAISASNTNNPPNLAASWGAEDNLWIIFSADDNTLDGNNTAPTNYTNYGQVKNVEGGVMNPAVCVARRELNAASEDPGAWGGAGWGNWGCTVVVRPAAAAGGQPFDLRGSSVIPRILNPFVR